MLGWTEITVSMLWKLW
uniref:Uncharacterized protein n=1 Tax=Arundo donax TaxID=35708 RepID=A0A0A8ZIE8_ARUDO